MPLVPRIPQRGLQPLSFLVPPLVLGAGALLDILGLSLQVRGLLRVLALGLVERGLRFGHRLFAPFALSFSDGLFPPALGLATLLLLLEICGGFFGGLFADFGSGSLRRLGPAPFPPSTALLGSQEANLPLDPAGRLSTTPGFDIAAATTSGSSVSLATP